jgi:hypothetical protein
VVLLVAALILTAAVIVIGVTALRVTSADDGAGFDRSRQELSCQLGGVVGHLVYADDHCE